jgi:hypothetical protein
VTLLPFLFSKKDRQHNGQNKKDKRTKINLQNVRHKTKDWVTRTPLKPGSLICIYISISVCNTIFNSNTTGVTNGEWTAKTPNPSEAPEFTPVFVGICIAWSLVFCVVFSWFVLFLLLIALSLFHGIWFLIIHLVS